MKIRVTNCVKDSAYYIAWGVVVLVLTSCSRSPSFNDFMARDQKYYAELAQACDQLILQTNVVKLKPNHRPIVSIFSVSPDDANLPDVIRKIRPAYIEVDRCDAEITNCLTYVWIKVGVSGAGYGIRWSTNTAENGQTVWALSVGGGEAGGGVVYTKPWSNRAK